MSAPPGELEEGGWMRNILKLCRGGRAGYYHHCAELAVAGKSGVSLLDLNSPCGRT
jgi:hypothetical protein